jgi:hypothetical protein
MGCQSLECPWFCNKVHYKLEIQAIIIGTDTTKVQETFATISKQNYWDRKAELTSTPPIYSIAGNPSFEFATLAYRGFNFQLDKPHHYVKWHLTLNEEAYDGQTGTMQFRPELFFQQWAEGMKQANANRKYARWAFKRKGVLDASADVLLLQFKDACIQPTYTQGQHKWGGKGSSANTSDAIYSAQEILKLDCK